jgi:glyoxylase-like metal-dependent hydrolase (beta-lactamase superfamily II)
MAFSFTDYMSAIFHSLSPAITVIERGWLNCNQIVLTSAAQNVLIDSGYGRHAADTLRFVDRALIDQPIHWLINTHCHSDHMGGNRAVREKYRCRLTIPAGEVKHVVPWTEQSCWSEQMDQYAEQFDFDDTIAAGDSFDAGGLHWQAHAAPGHDMDALMFFAGETGVLITGDALWERGMGFVWPGIDAATGRNVHIDTALATLDVIEKLSPKMIVPGHGAPFGDWVPALESARSRLIAFEQNPARNARHVTKSLFVFALLDKGEMKIIDVPAYLESVPVYAQMREAYQLGTNAELAERMLGDLIKARAVMAEGGVIRPMMRA